MINSNSMLSKDFILLLKYGLDSINPGKLIRNAFRIEKNDSSLAESLLIQNYVSCSSDNCQEKKFDLNKSVYVCAFGKAALGMSLEIEKLIGSSHLVKGIAILPFNDAKAYIQRDSNETNEIYPSANSKIKYFYGAKNNLPDKASISATKKVYEMCKSLKKDDILLTLISGGGSALLTLPSNFNSECINEDFNFDLKLKTIKSIVQAGANINELNTVRSCLSEVKGGKLAALAHPAQVISLVISDVIDDPLDIIASGPTIIKAGNKAIKALEIIQKYKIEDSIPKEVLFYLVKLSKMPFSDAAISDYNVYNYLIGSNRFATQAIYDKLSSNELDYDFKLVLTNSLCGEAKIIGSLFAILSHVLLDNKEFSNVDEITRNAFNLLDLVDCDLFKLILEQSTEKCGLFKQFLDKIVKNNFELVNNKKGAKKICLISGGETTVNLMDNKIESQSSKGGRNMEMTLAFEFVFNKLAESKIKNKNFSILFSSLGSDGIDGPTDAAGAFYELDSTKKLETSDSQLVESYLSKHDSYNYYLKQNRLVMTGPTGTNVSDLQVLLINFDH